MSGGVGAALGDAMKEGADLPDGEQLVQAALFDGLAEADVGALDAPSPLSAALEPRRKGGRPKGARNRRTEAVAAWLLQQHRHPLAVMMEAYSMNPAQLAERIGLRKAVRISKEKREVAGGLVEVEVEVETEHYSNDVLLDVLKLQLRMAEAVAPYLAQKMPQAVQLDARAAVQLSLAGVSLPARGGAAEGENQVVEGEVIGVSLPKSDGGSRTDG
jgi:hypothetical protein